MSNINSPSPFQGGIHPLISPAVTSSTPNAAQSNLTPYETNLLKSIKNAGSSDVDLVMACKANDTSFGTGTRNCCTISLYETIMGESVLELDGLKEAIKDRPYLFLVNTANADKQSFLIKNDIQNNQNAPDLQIYDEPSQQFVKLEEEVLEKLPLDADSRIIFLNTKIKDDKVECYHSDPTPTSKPANAFYHEKQKDGQCGIHSANAFLGERVITPSKLTEFNESYYGGNMDNAHVTQFASEYADSYETDITDASAGNNPSTLLEYLKDLASKGEIDNKYMNIELEFIPSVNDQDISAMENFAADRCILGQRGPDHFIAFRKDDNNKWFLINSEDAEQKQMSPAQFLETKKGQEIYFIH
jgi:hypothetical protein